MKLNLVSSATGFTWVKLGIQTFFKQPLALSGLFFIYMAVASVLALVPFVGIVLALAVVPAATLGLMAAAQEATRGKFPMPTVLISAFRAGKKQLRAMLVLGGMYAGACLAVMAVAPLITGMPATPAGPGAPTQELMLTPAFQRAMLTAMVMYLPISLVFWHAPALVHWHGVSPVKSLFFSAVACIRNAGALLVFGIGWVVVFFFASLVIALIAGLTGSPQIAATMMMPLALLLASMFSTSLFFTFRDSFSETPANLIPEETP